MDGRRVWGGLNPTLRKGDLLLLEIFFCCVNTQPSRTRQSGVVCVCRCCFRVICVWSCCSSPDRRRRVEKCGVKCFLWLICDGEPEAPLRVSVCPLKPVSSVFLHFLPREEGSNPLSHARCARAPPCNQVDPPNREIEKEFPNFPGPGANEKKNPSRLH